MGKWFQLSKSCYMKQHPTEGEHIHDVDGHSFSNCMEITIYVRIYFLTINNFNIFSQWWVEFESFFIGRPKNSQHSDMVRFCSKIRFYKNDDRFSVNFFFSCVFLLLLLEIIIIIILRKGFDRWLSFNNMIPYLLPISYKRMDQVRCK